MRLLAVLFFGATAVLAQEPQATAPVQAGSSQPKPDSTTAPAAAAASTSESPTPISSDWISGSIDIGYRWMSDVLGSYAEYRSTLNLGAGPRLFGLDAIIADPKKRLFDTINLRAYNWGDPYDTAHVDARKLGVYDFNFDYRSMVYFNAIPSYANPIAPAGFNEQSFDLLQRTVSFDLTLFPGKHVVPYLGYWHNSGGGQGIDTWVQDENDEFAVPIAFRNRANNYHGGVRFEYNHFHVTLEEGGTTYKDDDVSNFTGSSLGDNTTPVFGQTLVLDNLQQAYGIRSTGTYSKILATADPTSWINLYAQFLYSDPRTDVHFNESAKGNFAELSSLLFYMGEVTTAGGTATGPHISSNAGFELRPWRRLRILESWMTDRYHDAAAPLFADELILAPPSSTQNLLTSLNYSQVVNYNQEEVDAFLDLTRKITLRGGYRYVWGDATVVASQLSQTGTLALGNLQRNIGLGGLNFRASEKLAFILDYEGASSDHIYFRTSLNDYSLGRARARFQPLSSLAFQASFRILNNRNPDPSINYDVQTRDSSISIQWTPGSAKRVTFTGEYDRFTDRSSITYLLPEFLTADLSIYRDNAHTASSAIEITPPSYRRFAPKLTLGGSLFISSGSRPSRFYQPMALLSVPLIKHVSWNAKWLWYGFGEEFYLNEGFRTHMLLMSLRLSK